MENLFKNLNEAVKNGMPTEQYENDIAINIEKAVSYPEFGELGLEIINNILNKVERPSVKSLKTIIRICCEKYDEGGLKFLKNIKFEGKKEEEIIEILDSIESIPIIKEAKSVIMRLKKNIEVKNQEILVLKKETESRSPDGIEVDWEEECLKLKKTKEQLEEEIDRLNIEIKNLRDKDFPAENKTENPKEGSIRIFIKTLTGEVYPFYITMEIKVCELKKMIEIKHGISVKSQSLILKGKKLIDSQQLHEYSITPDSTIILYITKSKDKPDEEEFKIYVKLITGKMYNFKVTKGTTVYQLKEMIEKEDQIPIRQQRMVFAGRQMQNELTIGEYQVQTDSIINLMQILRY